MNKSNRVFVQTGSGKTQINQIQQTTQEKFNIDKSSNDASPATINDYTRPVTLERLKQHGDSRSTVLLSPNIRSGVNIVPHPI